LTGLHNNVIGTKIVANGGVMTAASGISSVSTDKAVRPTSIMGASKRLANLSFRFIARPRDTKFSIVRFGNV
jgi:FlaA1/EpsC-like NDP-sugar epimerase